MRLLAISDPHGDYTQVPLLVREAERTGSIDAALVAGDITNFGPDELAYELLDLIEPLGCPVLAIPGNCDQRSILATLDASKAVNLDGAVHTIENVTFAGIGGSNPTPFDTPFERSEDEIGAMLEDLLIRADRGGGTIVLLSHAPPKNTLDRIPGGNAGSDALARAIGKVDLIVCGHIHEGQGEMTRQGTRIVNVGQASQGQSVILTIDESIEVQFNNI
uniref:3',5'-cyclic adenosine monophosphate phosphodiesterase CpdA n=1 Tax=Candidatus Methanogaster sp. ANME-2c ERB4 TaxID=2759911 RepID=A0A7G9YPQ9_9EURY|nr:3',5'-cyclic adenosine monophosphate phosphodiesterase CpdA [Methanosarcinales archaeon ANME-2c ERB4]